MDDNNLESIFKDRFSNHREQIDSDDMISRLDLDKPKRKRRTLVFWLFGVIIGFSIIALTFQYNQLKKSPTELQVTKNSQAERVQKSETFTTKNDTINIKNNTHSVTSNENVTKSNNSPINTTQKINSSANDHAKTFDKYLTKVEPIHNSDHSSNDQALQKTKNIHSIEKTTSQNLTSTELNNQSENVNNPNRFLPFTTIPTLGLYPFDVSHYQKNITEIHSADAFIISPIKQSLQPHAYINLYSGVSYTLRNVASKKQEYDQYVDIKNGVEEQLESFHVGIAASRNIGRKYYVSSGIEYLQINEKATINYSTNKTEVVENYPFQIQIKSNGDTITNYGTTNINTPLYHQQVKYNNHKLLSLPVNIGFLGKTQKLKYFIDAGIVMNLYAGFYGSTLDINQRIESKLPFYNPKITLGIRSSLGIAYPIAYNIDLIVAAHYQNNFTSISDTKYISQTYKLVGIRLGANYCLNVKKK